ncbi:MAG: hypothetical protein J6V01_00960, partial [Clostridia bacterium]|nr:hypothetical protein [Clostridia bacterium]
MKKTLSVVIALAMIASLASVLSLNASAAWDGTAKTAFSGAGTAEEPYKISSPEELAYLAAQVNGGENYSGKLFVQTADIDLGGREWTPIGSAKASAFGGVYDGNGHKITGLSITDNTLVNAGLFGFIHNAEAECGVMNLSLKGKIAIASPTVAVPFIGGLAGQTEGLHDAEAGAVKYWVKLINIENDVEIDVNSADTQPRLGGIVGQATSTYFEYAVNKAKISTVSTNVSRTGGIVGQCTRVSFIACRNDGDVTAEVTTNAKDCQVAGITSVISSYGGQGFLFRYCVNNGKITGISEKAAVKNGGIFAGTWDGTNPKNNDLKTLVSYCANNGAIYSECKDVTKNDCTGGLVSYVTYGGVTIENSVNASADIVSKGAFGTTQGKIGGI